MAAPNPAVAAPICAQASATAAVATTIPGYNWAENLAFDKRGNLWVSHPYRNMLERRDRSGALTASIPIQFPASVRLGPDGLLYVNYGYPLSPGSGKVLRIDPDSTDLTPHDFAGGFDLPNGSTFDNAGNLYIADSAHGVTRVRPDGSTDTAWASRVPPLVGANGIAVHGNDLYVTLLLSPTTRVMRIPIDDPAKTSVFADLVGTPPFPPLFPDDLASGPDGYLYAATGSGQLVRLDSETGGVCTVLSDQPMTSLLVDPTSDHVLYAGTESGQILRIVSPK